jgi:hypothetical protein
MEICVVINFDLLLKKDGTITTAGMLLPTFQVKPKRRVK